MSANTNLSRIASTTKNTTNLHNNSSKENKFDDIEYEYSSKLKIVVTKHLCIPCPRLYTDIFKTILIICKDPSHKDDKYAADGDMNHLVHQLL